MRAFHLFCLLLVLALASGCSTFKKIPIPEYSESSPILIRSGEKPAPILFERLMVSIKRGTTVGAYHTGMPEGTTGLCNHRRGGPITWVGDRVNAGGVYNEAGNNFFRALTSYGYDVVGNPDVVFGQDKDLSRAKFKIAAVVTDIKTNICRLHDLWYGMPEGTDQGEMWIEVKWLIYSAAQEKIVTEFKTTGYFSYQEPKPEGFDYLFMESFSSAVEQLAAKQQFHDLLIGAVEPEAAQPMGPVGDAVVLPGIKNYTQPFSSHADKVINSVVTLRLASGHGSGFLVSDEGHILTNAHVVGNAETINVRFPGGFEVPGKILKVHAPRDVALVKVDVTHTQALPIRKEPVKITEPVYAIGAPFDVTLATTVSQGVVSAMREDDGRPLIQADVDIHGGNSGGALVDANGNVVGITVAGIMANAENKLGAGLNFFIPINDALEQLNIIIGR